MREITCLNENWQFGKWPEGSISALPPKNLEKQLVQLPHTWYKDDDQYEGIGVYERILDIQLEENTRAYLEFQGADRWCRVYINGVFLGEHKGGYSAFRFPLDGGTVKTGENRLTVVLDNRSYEEISPLAGDFTVYGGLYRDVNLILVPESHFDLMYYGTCGVLVRTEVNGDGQGVVRLEPHLQGVGHDHRILYEIYAPDGSLAESLETGAVQEESVLCLKSPVLWDGKENPSLYQVAARLLSGENVLDEVRISTGFRSISMDGETGFFLNGRHLRINGVARHQDFGQVFSATTPVQWERDMELIREIGANAVRLSHYQHPWYFYDLCDREGLVVWAEIPMLKMNDTKECMDNACSQMKELIRQNLHHPSICFWGIENEIAIFGEEEYMYENCRTLNRLVHQLDPGRLTTAANLYTVKNDSPLNHISDMVGYNIYFGWYYGAMEEYDSFLDKFHKDCPDVPLGISEYGVDCSIGFHQENPKLKDYSEEFQSLFHETVYKIIQSKRYMWGSFVWNMFDFGSARRNEGGVKYRNCKGLVTFDRTVKKDAFYYYKSQWAKEPFVYVAERRFEKRAAEKIRVKVYSNLPQVTLKAGQWQETGHSDSGIFLFENVPLAPGSNQITARAGQYSDQAVFERVKEPEASYTFVDPNPEINVRNWFLDEQEEAALFPKGCWSVMDPMSEMLKDEKVMEVIENWSFRLADAMRERKGSMPLFRILNYMRDDFKEDSMKELNRLLAQIKKES